MTDNQSKLLNTFHIERESLIHFLQLRLGCLATAEDLLHETYLKAVHCSLDQEIKNPTAYLYRIASNLFIDHHRAKQRQRLSSVQIEDLLNVSDGAPDTQTIVEDKRALKHFSEVFEKLPTRRKEIFYLSRFENLAHREIASRYGVTTRTVENEIKRVLDHCAQKLGRNR